MADLHAAIRERLDELDATVHVKFQPSVTLSLIAAIRGVVDAHGPEGSGSGWCATCTQIAPCSTIWGIAEDLEVQA